jgi:hypothetical protein
MLRVDICTYIRRYQYMTAMFSGFGGDDGNRNKCLKHGVTVEEIDSAFEEERCACFQILPTRPTKRVTWASV